MSPPDLTPYLTDDLRRAPWRGHPNPVAGQCYTCAEAHFHLWARAAGYGPCFIRWEGAPHWFLRHRETGQVFDPTAGQFATVPDYGLGTGKGFLTREPSKRALRVLEAFYEKKPA